MRRLPLALSVLLACSSATAPDVVGTWGGTDASLILTRAGGTLGYACGSGAIGAGWTIDPNGRFAATGVHYFGGGPVPSSGRAPHPASYAGQVRGDLFDLSVTVSDLGLTLGPFRMIRGGPIVLERCL